MGFLDGLLTVLPLLEERVEVAPVEQTPPHARGPDGLEAALGDVGPQTSGRDA
jgi:hypothetical protein